MAWLAIRCAALTSRAQRSRNALAANSATVFGGIGPKIVADLPDFVALDLVGPSVIGEKKKVYASMFKILYFVYTC